MYRRDSCQNKIKSILLLLAFLAVIGTALGSQRALPLFTDAQIQQAIIQTLGEPDFHPDSDHKIHYLARAADLNDDKKEELLVWAGCCGYGGTGGYHLLIFTNEKSKLKLVTKIAHVWTPLIVKTTKHNGWHDIVFQQGGGGAEFEYVVSQYNGKGYLDDNHPTIRPKQIKGKWLMGKQRVLTIIGPRPLLR